MKEEGDEAAATLVLVFAVERCACGGGGLLDASRVGVADVLATALLLRV